MINEPKFSFNWAGNWPLALNGAAIGWLLGFFLVAFEPSIWSEPALIFLTSLKLVFPAAITGAVIGGLGVFDKGNSRPKNLVWFEVLGLWMLPLLTCGTVLDGAPENVAKRIAGGLTMRGGARLPIGIFRFCSRPLKQSETRIGRVALRSIDKCGRGGIGVFGRGRSDGATIGKANENKALMAATRRRVIVLRRLTVCAAVISAILVSVSPRGISAYQNMYLKFTAWSHAGAIQAGIDRAASRT